MKIKKIMSTLLSILLISSNVIASTMEVDATMIDKSVSTSGGGGDVNVDVDVTVITNIRTMGYLDVAKIVFTPNKQNGDYKPNLRQFIENNTPELQFADITEWEMFEDDTLISSRDRVIVDENSPDGYQSKLEELINNNILTRTERFMWDDKGAETTKRTKQDGEEDKFYNASERVKKTDFLTNLLKTTDGPMMSRLFIVKAPYKRIDENLNEVEVLTEPIEQSPYQKYMGQMGIDSQRSDMVINHMTFGQNDLIFTSDVSELYLDKAISKNIIRKEEIGGPEGNSFLSARESRTVTPSWRDTKVPLRQRYDLVTLSGKEVEEKYKDTYPEKYWQFKDTIKSLVKIEQDALVDITSTMPWGDSFKYNTSQSCGFFNPFNKQPMLIEKKNNSEGSTEAYQYFKKEELTLLEAYMLTYKALKSGSDTRILSKAEVDFINSAYNTNLGILLPEEKEAVEYLIATGIVNGEDTNLYRALNQPVTNELMVEILYRILKKDARFEFSPNLTETDKEMLKRGYGQSKINLTQSSLPDAKTRLVSDIQSNFTKDTFADYITEDINKNPATYNQIFVRLPKSLAQGNDLKYTMVVDDEYRSVINPAEVKTIEEYTWARYITHKEASNLLLIANQDSIYNLKGINGEGVYIISEGVNKGVFEKLSIIESKTNRLTKEAYQTLISPSIEDFNKKAKQAIANANIEKPIVLSFNKPISKIIKDLPGVVLSKSRNLMAAFLGKPKMVAYKTQNNQPVIVRGPYKSSHLEFYKYKNDFLFIKENNVWKLNPNHKGLAKEEKERFDLRSSGEDYYVFYTPLTQAYEVELAKFINNEKIAAGSGDAITIPGYAKMESNGTNIAMIGKSELKDFGIEALSDKVLINTNTNQRAFLNTDDSYTLIGNNITHYPSNTLMVTLMGDKVFYNLNILVELINDTNTITEFAGSQIFVGNTGDKFQLVDVKDVELNTVVDRTYLLNNAGTSDTFLNLSALTGLTSNFIFFKSNNDVNLSALVVYRPKDTTVVSSDTNNSLLDYIGNKEINKTGSVINKTQQIIMDKLFKLDKENIIAGQYHFDVYLLTNNLGSETPDIALTAFLSYLSDGNQEKLDLLKKSQFDPVFNIPSGTDTLVNFKNININDNFNNDLLIHGGSRNLYFRIRKGSADQSALGRSIFYQNFYLNTQAKEVLFRRYHFYQNTPDKHIPLEIYGKNVNHFGYLENRKLINFGTKTYKLPFKEDNTITIEHGNDSGVYTRLELPFIKLDSNELSKLRSLKELDNYLYKKSIKEFKKAAPNYDIEEAMKKSKYGWKNTLSETEKRQFLSGSWEGVASTRAYYNLLNSSTLPKNQDHKILTTGHYSEASTHLKQGYGKSNYYVVDTEKGIFKSYEELKDVDKLPTEIYFKPSVLIPAGTTLVDLDGNLIYKPSNAPRNELYYIADLVNALVSRIKDRPIIYLHEVPKGSLVHITEGRSFVKISAEQTKESGSLKWVDGLAITKSTQMQKGGVTDQILYYDFINNWAEVEIPYNFGYIKIKQILGRGLFRLPRVTDLESIVLNNQAVEIVKDKGKIWGRIDGSDNDYKLTGLEYNKTEKKFKQDVRATSAELAPILLLPPTIEVEKHPTLEGVYVVKAYHDISKFLVDPDNTAVNFLMSKDTPAKSILGILDQLRSSGLRGMKYKNYAFSKILEQTFNFFVNFISKDLPFLLIAFWVLLSFLFILLSFEITRLYMSELESKLGVDLVSKFSFGFIKTKEPPSLRRYLTVSLIVMLLATLLFEGLIFKFIIKMFELVWLGSKALSEIVI